MDRTQELILTLAKIRNLPSLPAVIDKLRAAVKHPNADATAIATIIDDDPAMMATILKVVNSALYMGREPITSLRHAVARLGLKAISNIALSTGVFSTFPKTAGAEFDREQFWQHSISAGIAAVTLYDRCKPNLAQRYTTDVLHLSGLLHDIGKIILDQFLHADFIAAVFRSQDKSIPLIQAETEIIGTDHAQLGEWLGMKWNLGSDFLQTIRWHHDPESADADHRELVMLSHCSNYICNLRKLGDGGDVTAPKINLGVWQALGLKSEDVPSIVAEVSEKAKKSEVLMALGGGTE